MTLRRGVTKRSSGSVWLTQATSGKLALAIEQIVNAQRDAHIVLEEGLTKNLR